eukprot:254104_1
MSTLLWRFLFCIQCCLSVQNVLFNGEASIILSYSDRYNNTAFNLSLQEFLTDFYNAFGLIALMNDVSDIPYICSIDGIGQYDHLPTITTIYLGLFSSNPYPQSLLPDNGKHCYTGNQSHCVQIVYDTKKHMHSLVAMSNDTLGAQYAMYTVAEKIFGVDPLYRFSGINGEYYPHGIQLPSNLSYFYDVPVFEYRAMFNNDEDILGGWAKDPLGLAVHSATVFNWYFESTLRMKGNAMIVGTVPYPDEKSLQMAAKRGLAITDHHFNLLGMNTFRFPGHEIGNEWDYTTYPQTTTFVWKQSSIAMQNLGRDIIYSVGYRGTNDGSAPCPNCTEQQLGMVISQVIANMSQWLPHGANKITYMWGEAITLYKNGWLIIPDDVDMLLSDGGNGYIQYLDEFANESSGFYTHVAYYGQGNQLTEMVSPQRQFNQIATFSKTSKKNKYGIINTSDLRPYLLSTMAVFCYLYDPSKCGNGDAHQYIMDWVGFHYRFKPNSDKAFMKQSIDEQITEIYGRYYNISYVDKGLSDMYLHNTMLKNMALYIDNVQQNATVTNQTLQAMKATLQSDEVVAYISDLYQDSSNLLQKTSDSWTDESRLLYESHILLQQSIHYYANHIMKDTYLSAVAYNALDYAKAYQYIERSYGYFQEMFGNFRRFGETDRWRGFYLHSRIADFQAIRANYRRLYVLVNNSKHCELPTRPYEYYDFTWYQLPFHDNYPLMYLNKSAHLSSLVRVYCVNTGSEINNANDASHCCMNNANGAIFHVNAECKTGAKVKFNVTDWELCPIIRYTTDGSEPDPDYSLDVLRTNNVIDVVKSTEIHAVCQYQNKSLDQQVTKAFFKLI